MSVMRAAAGGTGLLDSCARVCTVSSITQRRDAALVLLLLQALLLMLFSGNRVRAESAAELVFVTFLTSYRCSLLLNAAVSSVASGYISDELCKKLRLVTTTTSTNFLQTIIFLDHP